MNRSKQIDLVKTLMNLFVCGIKIQSEVLNLSSVINMLRMLEAVNVLLIMKMCYTDSVK